MKATISIHSAISVLVSKSTALELEAACGQLRSTISTALEVHRPNQAIRFLLTRSFIRLNDIAVHHLIEP